MIHAPKPSNNEHYGAHAEDDLHGLATLSALPGVESKREESEATETTRPVRGQDSNASV